MPVLAAPSTSRPVSRCGMVRACTSVMCAKPMSAMAACVCGVSSRESKRAALMMPLTRAATRSTVLPSAAAAAAGEPAFACSTHGDRNMIGSAGDCQHHCMVHAALSRQVAPAGAAGHNTDKLWGDRPSAHALPAAQQMHGLYSSRRLNEGAA